MTAQSGGSITLNTATSTYIGGASTEGDDLYICDQLYDWDSPTYKVDPNGTNVLYTLDARNYIYDAGGDLYLNDNVNVSGYIYDSGGDL